MALNIDVEGFYRELGEAYGALQQDPEAWAEELRERAEWDATLMDGLKAEDLMSRKIPEID